MKLSSTIAAVLFVFAASPFFVEGNRRHSIRGRSHNPSEGRELLPRELGSTTAEPPRKKPSPPLKKEVPQKSVSKKVIKPKYEKDKKQPLAPVFVKEGKPFYYGGKGSKGTKAGYGGSKGGYDGSKGGKGGKGGFPSYPGHGQGDEKEGKPYYFGGKSGKGAKAGYGSKMAKGIKGGYPVYPENYWDTYNNQKEGKPYYFGGKGDKGRRAQELYLVEEGAERTKSRQRYF